MTNNTEPNTALEKEHLLLDAKDLQRLFGLPKSRAYQLLNNANMPVIVLRRRRYMNRDKFIDICNNHPELFADA